MSCLCTDGANNFNLTVLATTLLRVMIYFAPLLLNVASLACAW